MTKRLYQQPRFIERAPFDPLPLSEGCTLCEMIRLFQDQGIIPDVIPADFGVDDDSEIGSDGMPLVDPHGDIRTDPFSLRERQLVGKTDVQFEGVSKTFFDDSGNLITKPE